MRRSGRFLDFTLELGLPSWRYEIDGVTVEMSIVLPSGQNILHATFRVRGDGQSVRLRLRPLINFRALESAVNEPTAGSYVLTARGRRYDVTAGPDFPTLRMTLEGGDGGTFTADGGARRECFYEIEAQRGYESRGWMWTPGYFAGELRKDCPLTLIAATEPWHTVMALSPEDALTFERERRRRLVAMADAPARSGMAAELVLAADTFVIVPAGPYCRCRAGARRRRRGSHGDRRLSLVHRLGPRHDDLARRVDAVHRAADGSLLDPPHFRSLRARRAHAEHVPGRAEPRRLSHGRRDAMVLSRAASLSRSERRIETTLRLILPTLKRIVQHHIEGTRFGIERRSRRRASTSGRRRLCADLDGREGGRLGGDATARKGSRDQRTLVQRIAAAAGLACRERRTPLARLSGSRRKRPTSRSTAVFGMKKADISTMSSMARTAMMPRSVQTRSWPSRSIIRSSTPSDGDGRARRRGRSLSRPWGSARSHRESPDYKPRYYGDLRARDAAYHQGTVWAWLIGPFIDAWLKVHPEDREGARRDPRRLRAAPCRGRHRIDQRDLRR